MVNPTIDLFNLWYSIESICYDKEYYYNNPVAYRTFDRWPRSAEFQRIMLNATRKV